MGGGKLTCCISSMSFFLLLVIGLDFLATPATSLQFCGKDLANALALVCAETGYTSPWEHKDASGRVPRDARRVKRGIVDECCRSSCGWSTIEAYCQPVSSSTTMENLPIQKRSDPPSEAEFKEQVRGYVFPNSEDTGSIRHQKRRIYGQTEDAIARKNNRIFHSSGRWNSVLTSSKVKRNDRLKSEFNGHPSSSHKETMSDAIEREILNKSYHDQGRHHHKEGKQSHNELTKGKGAQIGTVPPYFLGRTLVSRKSRKVQSY